MPNYVFLNTQTDEIEEHWCSMTEYPQFKLDNPHLEPRITGAPTLVHETGSRLKVDDGFREVISKIKSNQDSRNYNIKDH